MGSFLSLAARFCRRQQSTEKLQKPSWVYIPVPISLANRIYQWGLKNIPDDDLLAEKPLFSDTRVLPENMHLTLLVNLPPYSSSLRASIDEAFQNFLRNTGTNDLEIQLGNITSFNSGPRDIIKVDLGNAAHITRLRDYLAKLLPDLPEDVFPYHPHITIAFCKKKEENSHVLVDSEFSKDTFSVDRLMCIKNNN